MTIKEEAVKNLKTIKSILDELNVKFWIDGGTCLGAYRDKDFCEGDEDDIDLCCTYDNIGQKENIVKLAKEKGFELWHNWQMEIALTKNGSKVDIFFYKKQGEEYFSHLYSGNQIHSYCVVPAHFYENLEPIKFYDMDFQVPSPIEEYLTYKYGDWKTKIHRKDYSCVNQAQNKVVRKHYDEI